MSDTDRPELIWSFEYEEPGPELILFKAKYRWWRNPRNGMSFKRIVLDSVDWVNVVAVDENGDFVMVEQFRFGIDALTLEVPGGLVDPGEEPAQSARRELLEETGYGGGEWRYLGAVQPNPAFHNHLCHHFLAQGVERLAEPDLGTGEAIAVHRLPVSEVRAAVQDGRIQHVLVISALGRVLQLWPMGDTLSGG